MYKVDFLTDFKNDYAMNLDDMTKLDPSNTKKYEIKQSNSPIQVATMELKISHYSDYSTKYVTEF